jgi:hypothetical protein
MSWKKSAFALTFCCDMGLKMSHYPELNSALCALVGLDRFYPFRVSKNLKFAGLAHIQQDGEIELACDLGGAATRVYLHEVAHVVAFEFGFNETLNCDSHNQYFAALVVLMYRRAGILDAFKVYDFYGSSIDDRDAATLAARFEFAITQGEELDRAGLSVSEAALRLQNAYKTELIRTQPQKIFAADEIRAFCAGFFACAAIGIAIFLGK